MQMIRLDVGQLRHARAQHIDQRCREVNLPDVPGLEPKALRDLYGAQYPELLSAEIDVGPLADGKQELVFRKAVGTKGAGGGKHLAAFARDLQAQDEGRTPPIDAGLSSVLERRGVGRASGAWSLLAEAAPAQNERPVRLALPSDVLPPLP